MAEHGVMRWLAAAVILALAASGASAADGDVVAAMTGRTLTLTGDAGANWVTLTSGGATGAVTVTPAGGATLNGAAAPVTFQRVRNVVARMGAGADRVDVGSVKLSGSISMRLDDGNDSVYFNATTVRGRVSIRCGDGLDLVRTDGATTFHGSFRARGGAGNDEVQIVGAQFRDRVRLEGGSDDDRLLLQSVACLDTARLEMFAGRGLDLAEIVSCQLANDVHVDMGPDEDRARVAATRFFLDLTMLGGWGGGDVLSLEGGVILGRLEHFDGFEEGEPAD
jgi:hypothetical protein